MCIDNHNVWIKNTIGDCYYDEAALNFATRRLVYICFHIFTQIVCIKYDISYITVWSNQLKFITGGIFKITITNQSKIE